MKLLKTTTTKEKVSNLKKLSTSVLAVLFILSISATSFAASSDDPLAKFKDFEKADISGSSVIATDTTIPTEPPVPLTTDIFQTSAEIKAQLGDTAKNSIDALKSAALVSSSAPDYFKLAVAYELISDNNSAVEALTKAITLAPSQESLYAELVIINQTQNPGKISVFVNGDKIDFKIGNEEVNPALIGGRTLVPIRKITEKLGAKVSWDVPTLTAKIQLADTTIQLVQDSVDAKVNGNSVAPLEVPAKNLNGHIVVPLRFISEQFNKSVNFIPGNNGAAVVIILDK
jgi:hypothetical protein